MNIDKYLISEAKLLKIKAKSYRMKNFLEVHDVYQDGKGIRATQKGQKPSRNVGYFFKNMKEFEDFAENEWTSPVGGTQSSQF